MEDKKTFDEVLLKIIGYAYLFLGIGFLIKWLIF